MNSFQCDIVTIPAYRGVGLKWNGTYDEISDLKRIISDMKTRVNELTYAINPDVQLGLSYHLIPNGFVHYSVYEVSEQQTIPVGMIEINVPTMTYLLTKHEKGQNVGQTYKYIFQWLQENDVRPYHDNGEEYFDDLPIKHERYPIDLTTNDPHFDILIPIIKNLE
ncbi:GyrI-like domain-containing protein [Aquibacillus rhizosphaerae]|uniref:GyrI-like domain-containing protein n=1 Tax=Aquibacillus rhizosphaerae TaxID=3051431 RepID=A0ABT7LAV2_9BACI|nr:GyrI-like domain-containing protein [Aquibacillus sp. LR5S19]MDL4842978.1 GyrI-like domain-containing protein [Aquibacillus sp. LR5S19]